MAVIAANKFIQVSGAPSGGEQAMASGSWGESATGILTNGALAFPKVAGTLDDLLSVDNSGNVIYVTRGGIDTTAFHNNVAAEISAITSKATPIGADYLLIEDSADSNNKKRILISALPSGGGGGTPGGSDTQVQYNDGGAFGGMSALTYNDSTGKITANAGASATGDFEVLAETTGTVVYADVSTGNTIFGQGVTGSRTVEMHGGNGASAELIIHSNSGGLGSNQDTSIRFKSGSLTRWRMGVDEGTTDDPFVIDPSGSLSGTAFSISRASGNPAKFGGNLTVNGGRIDCLNTASSPASVTIDSLNRASSLSIISRSSGGGSGRDAYMRFRIGTGDHFYIGMDDNDSGILKISGNGYFGSEDFMTFDQSTFKTVLNASASATGDFEVKAQTSGTAMYVDVSTSNVGIGTDSPSIAGFGTVLTIVEAADTNNARIELHKVTNDSDGTGIGSYEFTHALVSGANSRVAFMSANLSGATAGNRGGKLDFRTKADGSSTLNSHMTIDDTGKMTANVSGLSSGDFEVKAQTSGTAMYVDVSTSNVGIGTSSPSIAGFGRVLTIVEAADTNNGKVELHKVTNDSDGTGIGSYEFTHALVSGANSRVAFMSANLSGATAGNRGGKLDFRTKANGSSTINSHMTIDDTGKITTNASALSTGDFEVLAETTGTAFKVDVSANTLALFKDTADVRGLGVNTLTVNGESNTPIIEFNTDRADTDGSLIGLLTFTYDPYTNKNLGAYGVALDGSTVGNRGSKFQVFTKKDASALALVNFEIRESGKINMNPSFLSGANIEVGASGSGTAAFFDIVGKQWIIGSKVVRADTDLALDHSGVLTLAERSTTPTAIASYGKVYAKSDDKLYFQDGAGAEHEIAFV